MQEIMQKYGNDAGFYSAMKIYHEGLKNLNYPKGPYSDKAKRELDKSLEMEWAKVYGHRGDVYLHHSKISKLAAFNFRHKRDVEQAIAWLENHPQFYVKHENNLHSLFLTNLLNQTD